MMHTPATNRNSALTVFNLIKTVTDASGDNLRVIQVVRDLASAALERNDAYVNHYLSGGTLSFAEWKELWAELTQLDQSAHTPGWRATPEYERQVAVLERQLSIAS